MAVGYSGRVEGGAASVTAGGRVEQAVWRADVACFVWLVLKVLVFFLKTGSHYIALLAWNSI